MNHVRVGRLPKPFRSPRPVGRVCLLYVEDTRTTSRRPWAAIPPSELRGSNTRDHRFLRNLFHFSDARVPYVSGRWFASDHSRPNDEAVRN